MFCRSAHCVLAYIGLLGILLGFQLSGLGYASANEKLDLTSSLTAFEAFGKSVQSYDIRLTAKWEWLLKTEVVATKQIEGREVPVLEWRQWSPGETRETATRNYRQIRLADGRRRIERLDNGSVSVVSVFSQEMLKRYTPSEEKGFIGPTPGRFVEDGDDYSTYFINAFGVYPYVDLFRSRPSTRLVPEIADPGTIAIEAPPGEGAGWRAYGFRVWLSLKHGLAPSKIERYRASGNALYDRAEITEFTQLPSGIWVPIKMQLTFFNPGQNEKLYGEPTIRVNYVVDMTNSKWNQPISDDTFRLSFPPGTRVTDRIRKLLFVTTAQDSGDNIKELVKNAKDVIPIHTAKASINDGGIEPRRFHVLLLSNIAILLVFLALWIRKRMIAPRET